MSHYLVIIPTYNEIENIEAMVHRVMGLEKHIDLLVVDDGSPDGTGQKVKDLQATYRDRLHLLERSEKNGLGTAYIAGFHWALDRPYTHICEMDCDFSHPVDQLPKLIEHCEGPNAADLCVGSRYVGGVVNVVNWPMGRVLMSYYASKYVQFITGLNVADTTAGFVCYQRQVLETIGIDGIKFRGYAFQIEMKFRSAKKGYRIAEHPIIFTDRTAGTSKMSTKIFREALFGVIELKLKSIFGRL
ncbi:MAG: polyprenol monophosphomannose synthase [Bacteroidetes bacterium]|nr:polyprenol monophosphomannose synthase [Bacteroidota bacterium]MDA0944194.1 polyprenol monophosphomannose synthase [Bacteroidota bacterium]MDA1112624.1 polyprenol monophosphomannose synthase [Bacteroidota bacterium]